MVRRGASSLGGALLAALAVAVAAVRACSAPDSATPTAGAGEPPRLLDAPAPQPVHDWLGYDRPAEYESVESRSTCRAQAQAVPDRLAVHRGSTGRPRCAEIEPCRRSLASPYLGAPQLRAPLSDEEVRMSVVAAWEAFHCGEEPVGVRDEVLFSWRRSRWSGVDPQLDVPPAVPADADSPFVRVAAPVLLRMADLLTNSRTCLSLTDRHGHVVWRWVSDAELRAECDRAGVQFGLSFNEQQVGTCGIGTALETGWLASVSRR